MFEGTKVRMTTYFRFTVKPDRTEIWKGIVAYQLKFHRTPDTALYNTTDRAIGELLIKTAMPHVGPSEMVPEGQIWFYVPGGFSEVVG